MKNKSNSDNDYFVCWIDELNFYSLAKLYFLKRKYNIRQVRFIYASWWVKALMRTWPKIFSSFQQAVLSWMETIADETIVESMRDRKHPEAYSRSILGNFSELTSSIQKNLGNRYDFKKVELFFEQEAAEDLEWPIKLINLAYESCRDNDGAGDLVLVKHTYCIDSARLYAQERSIEVVTYFNIKEVCSFFYFPLKFIAEIIYNAFLVLMGRSIKTESDINLPKIATLYSHGADLNKRCDFFWFPKSGIDPKQMIVYFKHYEHPPTKQALQFIQGHNITWLNLLPSKLQLRPFFSGSIELNRFPTWSYVKRLAGTLAFCMKLLIVFCLSREKLLVWFWIRLIRLFNDVELFAEFFEFYNIKVHFAAYEMGRHMTAANLAICRCGGIDLTHLWSHLDCVVHQMGKPHDVYFIWGPYYKRHFFDRSFYRVQNYIYVGYIYDYCFALGKEKSLLHRKKLLNCGASFIVCFCDQATMATPSVWNEGQERLYRYLLNTVIERNDFAVIFKAKRADGKSGLTKKFPELSDLIEKAVETTRCLILDSDSVPAEAAQAADLAIGMGAASTPALEAVLCGIPAITYDPEGNLRHPMHAEGCSNLIFSDFESLVESINKFARGKHQNDIGNYSRILSDIDPFRDGRAQIRVGQYIKDILVQLTLGYDKCQAIEFANGEYAKNFGLDKLANEVSKQKYSEYGNSKVLV